MSLAGQHFLGLRGVSADVIHAILDASEGFRDISRRTIKKVPTLRGRTVLNVFLENSTRTRISFELAAKRLSADGVNMSASGSSTSKGESLVDTAQTLDAMQADVIVLRHGQSGAPQIIAKHVKARVINAGDGRHEHPTQGLLDMLTMRQRFGRLEGLQVAIVGDVTHSRVARSNLIGLKTMGAQTRVFGPSTLMPRDLANVYGTTVCTSLRECLEGAHVVMTLRLQKERMTSGLLPELREYSRVYGLNSNTMKLARPDAIVMHPGPVNRGVEISAELMDSAQSVILDQVENGVAVRAALLYLILGGDES